MTLSSGTRLGPYEILAPIGAGGMGEVYRARDTRLERTVAVKVLPPHLSSAPESRQRFEREAKTISQLSHPHICALHDVGREGETEYLVMEYLEGETLADRLLKGPLPLEQTLRYGIQIADALDKAHRQGIAHRDLKPGNVMITKSGVKLLDFGLAKAMAQPSIPTAMGSPNLTQEGTILGTFQYMAPEQLEKMSVRASASKPGSLRQRPSCPWPLSLCGQSRRGGKARGRALRDPLQFLGDVAGALPPIFRIFREAGLDDPIERRRRHRLDRGDGRSPSSRRGSSGESTPPAAISVRCATRRFRAAGPGAPRERSFSRPAPEDRSRSFPKREVLPALSPT